MKAEVDGAFRLTDECSIVTFCATMLEAAAQEHEGGVVGGGLCEVSSLVV